jgi:hypothetical protein
VNGGVEMRAKDDVDDGERKRTEADESNPDGTAQGTIH